MLSFFVNDTATTEIYTLSLHDALPISQAFHCLFFLRWEGSILFVGRAWEATTRITSLYRNLPGSARSGCCGTGSSKRNTLIDETKKRPYCTPILSGPGSHSHGVGAGPRGTDAGHQRAR